MSTRAVRITASALLICASCAAYTLASPTSYGDFMGGKPDEVSFLQVTEDSVTDLIPLFEEPTRVANKLLFFPTEFAAYAANGLTDATSGTLTLMIQAPAGYFLDKVFVNEVGDCTLLGAGSHNTWADVYGFLGAADVIPGTHGAWADFLKTSPKPPFTLPGSSFTEFNGHAQIDLSGLGISRITLAFTDTLEAASEPGTTAYMQKKAFSLEATTIEVPEPATVLLFTVSLITLLTRGRPTHRPLTYAPLLG